MKVKISMLFILLGLIMAWTFVATAEDKPADTMKYVLEKIRADKKLLIAENLQLTETQAEAFWPIYERYQNDLLLHRARHLELINRYAEAYGNITNDGAKEMLDEYLGIEALKLDLHQTYLPEFQTALTDIQTFRFCQIENKIDAALMYELANRIPLIQNVQ